MLVVTRQRRSWSKGSLPLRQARFRYEDVSSGLRLTAKRLNSRPETVTFDYSLPVRMVPVSALLSPAARGRTCARLPVNDIMEFFRPVAHVTLADRSPDDYLPARVSMMRVPTAIMASRGTGWMVVSICTS